MQYNQSNISANNDIAIEVNNVRKRYRLFKSRNDRVKEAISLGRKQYHQEFWALDGISFSVTKGETIGILGRNGSGKSTLLQILASVMTETTGDVVVNGRVAALLELGAGFKPEFTGRENVILNGVIQGVSEKQMIEKIDEMREFADIGDFFDQPVGAYSTGMFVRLGFSAALSVEPDVLIIDEALGVGDVLFQEKCFMKIRELQRQGVTIMIVSHSGLIIERLCKRAIVLDKGKLLYCGNAVNAVDYYDSIMFSRDKTVVKNIDNITHPKDEDNVNLNSLSKDDVLEEFLDAPYTGDLCVRRNSYNDNEVRFGNGNGEIIDYLILTDSSIDPKRIVSGEKIDIYIKFIEKNKMEEPSIGLGIFTHDGIMLCASNTSQKKMTLKPVEGKSIYICKLSFNCLLNEGNYFIHLGLTCRLDVNVIYYDMRRSIACINVEPTKKFEGLCDLDFKFTEVSNCLQ
jgi:lipopolysaccharide transport system ATP-binding protein